MTKHGIGSRVAVSLAFTALNALMGCAGLPEDDQQASDDEVIWHDRDEAEVLAQQIVPPPNSGPISGDNIRIESVAATGAGCPRGSWTAEMVPEGNAFTITFNSYVVEAPPTSTPSLKRLPCDISLKVRTPRNLSYAVTSFQYFGYANLSPGMKARLIANYAFTGLGVAPALKTFQYDFPVPYNTTFAVNDNIQARGNAPSWAPCDISSNLQVRTSLVLEAANTAMPGVLAMDNLDGRAEAALKINFRTGSCPPR